MFGEASKTNDSLLYLKKKGIACYKGFCSEGILKARASILV
jgi:hypothetical protein